MPIRTVKPTSPGRRFQALQTTEDITASTLWEAATKASYIVGSVSWPVTVGATSAMVAGVSTSPLGSMSPGP